MKEETLSELRIAYSLSPLEKNEKAEMLNEKINSNLHLLTREDAKKIQEFSDRHGLNLQLNLKDKSPNFKEKSLRSEKKRYRMNVGSSPLERAEADVYKQQRKYNQQNPCGFWRDKELKKVQKAKNRYAELQKKDELKRKNENEKIEKRRNWQQRRKQDQKLKEKRLQDEFQLKNTLALRGEDSNETKKAAIKVLTSSELLRQQNEALKDYFFVISNVCALLNGFLFENTGDPFQGTDVAFTILREKVGTRNLREYCDEFITILKGQNISNYRDILKEQIDSYIKSIEIIKMDPNMEVIQERLISPSLPNLSL